MYKIGVAKGTKTAYTICVIKWRKERDSVMMNNWIMGDLDDMIFGDCRQQVSER